MDPNIVGGVRSTESHRDVAKIDLAVRGESGPFTPEPIIEDLLVRSAWPGYKMEVHEQSSLQLLRGLHKKVQHEV